MRTQIIPMILALRNRSRQRDGCTHHGPEEPRAGSSYLTRYCAYAVL